jgi:glycosyltransferase involved in cell wall biosynthesis
MLVSIIIAARDEDPQVVDATIAGLHETTRGVSTEVILVDDGSRTPVTCGDWHVRIVRNPVPVGSCRSRRLGAMIAEGDVLVWMDAHMSFGENWLHQMLVHSNSDTLLCSPFWTYDLRECMCWGADFVWNATRDYGANKHPGLFLKHRTDPPDRPLVEVPMIIGACYMMRRSSYERLGGFSPHFRVWGIDEQEISARAWMAGMKVACASYAKAGHLSRAAFPYPVQFEDLEFNQIVMFRTLFEQATIDRLDPHFQPIPPVVEAQLAQTNLRPWRQAIQRRRKMTDQAFFERFIPELAPAPVSRRARKAPSA